MAKQWFLEIKLFAPNHLIWMLAGFWQGECCLFQGYLIWGPFRGLWLAGGRMVQGPEEVKDFHQSIWSLQEMASVVKGEEMGWCLKCKERGAVSVNSGGSKLEEGCKNRMETGGGHKGFWKEMYPCSIIYEDELRSELSSSDKAAGRVSLLLQHCGRYTMPVPPILNLLWPWVPSRSWPHSVVELLLLTASSDHLSHCVPWAQQTHFCPPFHSVVTPLSTSLVWAGKGYWKPESSLLNGFHTHFYFKERYQGIKDWRTGPDRRQNQVNGGLRTCGLCISLLSTTPFTGQKENVYSPFLRG